MFNLARIAKGLVRGAFGVGAVMCAISVHAAPASAQSLREELFELVRAHPQIVEARSLVRAAEQAVILARSGRLPSLSANASSGGEIISSPTTRAVNGDNDLVVSYTYGLELRQMLYDGGFTESSVESAALAREGSLMTLNSIVQAILSDGVRAYLDVLRLNELLRVSWARERTIREQLNLETERVERGAGIEVDVLQAKSRLQLAIEARVDLENQLETAVAVFARVFKREPDITRMIVEAPPPDLLPATLEEALFITSEENPVIIGTDLLVAGARRGIDVQRAAYVPRLDIVGNLTREHNVGGTLNHSTDATLLLEMSWDIFTGFSTDANVVTAQEFLVQALSQVERIRRESNEQVRATWSRLVKSRERAELLINAVSIAQEVFSARQRLREAGKETTLNVLDAESEVFQAEQNLIRAVYDSRIAVYDLAAAMGRLTPQVLGLDVETIQDYDSYLTDVDEVDYGTDPIESLIPAPQGTLGDSYGPSGSAPASNQDLIPDEQDETSDSIVEPPPVEGAAPSLNPTGIANSGPSQGLSDASASDGPVIVTSAGIVSTGAVADETGPMGGALAVFTPGGKTEAETPTFGGALPFNGGSATVVESLPVQEVAGIEVDAVQALPPPDASVQETVAPDVVEAIPSDDDRPSLADAIVDLFSAPSDVPPPTAAWRDDGAGGDAAFRTATVASAVEAPHTAAARQEALATAMQSDPAVTSVDVGSASDDRGGDTTSVFTSPPEAGASTPHTVETVPAPVPQAVEKTQDDVVSITVTSVFRPPAKPALPSVPVPNSGEDAAVSAASISVEGGPETEDASRPSASTTLPSAAEGDGITVREEGGAGVFDIPGSLLWIEASAGTQ